MTDEVAETTLLTHRDTMRSVSPPWLQRGLAEKILYAFALHCDAFADALTAGVRQRFPGQYSYDSLSLLGRERRIPRAGNDTDASFAARLTVFLDSHRRRGGPYALLEQLFIHFAPSNFPIDLLYVARGRLFAMDASGAITRSLTDWAPGNPAMWARWWLVYHTDQWLVTPPTDAEIAELRLIPRQWNAAHPIGTIVLMSSAAEFWNATNPAELWDTPGNWDSDEAPQYIEVEP